MITKDMIKKLAPTSKDEIVDPMIGFLNQYMPKYEVNTYLRVCHFLAQAAHESASFRTLEEYADGSAYEGRKDLGNVNKGDGKRYKGRGIFQLTGRSNYQRFGKLIGRDLEGNPELAESPEVSVLTALEYWKSRGLNGFADKDDVETITRRINGGLNGFDDRKNYLSKAKKIVPSTFTFGAPKLPEPPQVIKIDPIIVAKVGDNSTYIRDLQYRLLRKGQHLKADGAYGPNTELAVRNFQSLNGLPVTGSIDTDTLAKLMV